MKKTDIINDLLSTDSQMIIALWPKFCEYIKLQQPKSYSHSNNPSLLVDKDDIQAALNSPYNHYFHSIFKVIAHLSQLRYEFSIRKDETWQISEKSVINKSDYEKLIISHYPDDFFNEDNFKLFSTTLKEFDKLITQFYDENTQLLQHSYEAIQHHLCENNIILGEHEIRDLRISEPFIILKRRFTELNIPLPKFTKVSLFSNYLKCKVIIAIHSYLSGQHLPNTPKDVKTYLLKLSDLFKLIEQHHDSTVQSHQKQINQLLAPLLEQAE